MTPEEIYEQYTTNPIQWMVKHGVSTTKEISIAMMRLAIENIGCQCSNEIKTGTTSIHCCNICGKPDEEFWTNQNGK